MAEKTYLTPNLREPEFIMVPKGSVNENGVKQKRKAIKFFPNSQRTGQFITSDPKLQEFLDNHEWMKSGKLVCIASGHVLPTASAEQTQASGPVTSEVKTKKGAKKA